MNALDNIRMMFPVFLRGSFEFYPVVIIAASFALLMLAGLVYGIKRGQVISRSELDDIRDGKFIAALAILQTGCVLSVVLSFVFGKYFVSEPASVIVEGKIGFAIVTGAVIFMVMPYVFIKADWLVFELGFVPVYVFEFLTGKVYVPGEMVVQTVQKQSVMPGPRAKEVRPETHGDYIDYIVDKFRRVVSVGNKSVTVITRRGHLVTLDKSDPTLRRAGVIECIKYHDKFPARQMTQRLIHCCGVAE